MSDFSPIEKEFLSQITEIIQENISSEQFGVSELASQVGMSRSNLLRKVKKTTGLSVSQFIRQIRLQHAKDLLQETSLNVSQVSYKVGFGSTSYFIKCFHDYYGYPPGEAGNKTEVPDTIQTKEGISKRKIKRTILISSTFLGILIITLLIVFAPRLYKRHELEKSIAVLPFKNDSNDTTNVYIINGLMESILNNLQKIEDLRVISRTTVEKYRNSNKTIPEIAKELGVSYFIEGSGQKIGDQILLNIQLIEASSDKHLWGEQYKREATDIFDLQNKVAKTIVDEIEIKLTPEEKERINKIPTENPVAYDLFLKGLELLKNANPQSAKKAIPYFQAATKNDSEFARAYAAIAIAYYTIDDDQIQKIYKDSINFYADKALLLDPKLPQSIIAKGLYYMNIREFEHAATYFEQTLKYHPNSDLVLIFLIDLYVNHLPNTEKYLEYALRGTQLELTSYDSTIASFSYLHISNALIQNGFIAEAEQHINRSLSYWPENLYSQYVKAYILYAKNRNLNQTIELLLTTLKKDSTRFDILQEVGKIYYFMKDYENAYIYYKKFIDIKKALNIDVYRAEDAKIGVVLSELGLQEEAKIYFDRFKEFAENDQSIYQNINLAMYHSYMGNESEAIEHLKLFTQENNYHYWTIIFVPDDPLVEKIKDLPEFKKIINNIEINFWRNHERLKKLLKNNGLI